MEQQEHLDAHALAREAVLEGLAVSVGFQAAKSQFDLHPSPIQRHDLPSLHLSHRGTGHEQSRLRFPAGVLTALLAAAGSALQGGIAPSACG